MHEKLLVLHLQLEKEDSLPASQEVANHKTLCKVLLLLWDRKLVIEKWKGLLETPVRNEDTGLDRGWNWTPLKFSQDFCQYYGGFEAR